MTAFFSWQHAIRASKLEGTTKLVCYTIWSHMASDGTGCFPSYALIAEESGLSRRCVIEHVDKAEKAGFLAVDARQRDNGSASSNVYRPTMPGGDPAALGGDPSSPGGGDPAAPLLTDHLSNNPSNITPIAPKGAEPEGNTIFRDFWEMYPNKVGKPAALRAFNRTKASTGLLILGLERWIASEDWQKDGGRYIPHPATFLNQRRWEDVPRSMAKPKSDLDRRNEEFMKSFLAAGQSEQKQIA